MKWCWMGVHCLHQTDKTVVRVKKHGKFKTERTEIVVWECCKCSKKTTGVRGLDTVNLA